MLAWYYGLVVSELPLQTMATQAGVLATASRWIPRGVRRFAWLVSGLSWLGLLGLHIIGRSADVPLTAALDDGLGTDRRRGPGVTSRPPGPLRALRIYRDYAHDTDISCGEYGKKNLLDIWRRPTSTEAAGRRCCCRFPAGGWTTGSKRGQAHPLMSHLAELGWVCVSITYRRSPRSTWPDHIIDVKQAIAWVKARIAEYGGNPDFIAIARGSAGGHLSSLAALTANDPTFQPGLEDVDTRVQAAVPFYGVYDFTRTDGALHPMMLPFLERRVPKRTWADFPESFRAASPIAYVNEDAPPFFVLHGRNDCFIPVKQARSFVARLREVSRQPVVYAELPAAQHAFDIFGSARSAQTAVAVEQFLAEIYTPTAPSTGTPSCVRVADWPSSRGDCRFP